MVVNCKTGTAWKGVLWRRSRGWFVLKDAVLLADRGSQLRPNDQAKVDEEVLIERSNVDFYQRVSS